MPAPTAIVPSTYGTYYGANLPVVGSAGYGYMTQRPVNGVINSAPAVMPSTAPVTLVPDYRSTAARTPVTYYRPLMTTDPATGQQVVAMAPCTSYEYQTQRVPTWGLTQVYNGGATLPAATAVAPAVSPTYTLPRGGVPLAGPIPSAQPYATAYGTYPAPGTTTITSVAPTTGSVITPATPYSAGYPAYASNYGNYSALQPPVGTTGSSVYPTAPYNGSAAGLSPYYNPGTGTGGSCGNYVPQTQPLSSVGGASPYASSPYATNPGTTLVAPPTGGQPGMALPPSQVYPPGSILPGSSTPPNYSPVLPPSGDPAAGAQPSLPMPGQSNASLNSKPQLQNVVQQPVSDGRSSTNASTTAPLREHAGHKVPSTGLMPIPVPDDFKHEPRWNPGLLNEQDQTAANSIDNRSAALGVEAQNRSIAWGSKPIHWASFKQPESAELQPTSLRDEASALELTEPMSGLRDIRGAEEIFPTPLPLAAPIRGNRGSERAAAFVPNTVKMVPLPRAAGHETPASLELSSSSNAAPAPSAYVNGSAGLAPSASGNSSRYNTGGWQAK